MINEDCRPNFSSPDAPPPINVSFTTYHNVYAYSASKLWIAYGIAIGFSTICVASGLGTLFSRGAYYSADISTVLRALKDAHLSVEIDPVDANGRQPLPKYIGRAEISFQGARRGSNATMHRRGRVASRQEETGLETTATMIKVTTKTTTEEKCSRVSGQASPSISLPSRDSMRDDDDDIPRGDVAF